MSFSFDSVMPVPESGCWLFTGCWHPKGYGLLKVSGKHMRAHRAAWEAFVGKIIPQGLHVLHKCDTPACCNPDHLFLGTQADNMRDCSLKGRIANQCITHCPKGHPYEGENLYTKPSGRRVCNTCRRSSQKQSYWRRKKESANVL